MIGFKSEDTKAKFQSCVGAVSWFSQIIQAFKEFDIDERITWVDIEGIPLKLWSENTFNRIATKWGKILYMENLDVGCFHSKGYWVRAKETTGWFSKFDEQNEDNSDSKDEQSVGTIKEDFGGSDGDMEGENNVSVVLDTTRDEENVQVKVEESLQYPPGFIPCDVKAMGLDKNTTGINESSGVGGEKLDSVSVGSRNCKKVDIKRTGGSLLTVMEELIKVGKTMGYNMEGLNPKAKKDWVKEICVSHKVNFLTLQETKMESITLFDVKCCWGNFAFDHVYSHAVGNSGGILCVWDKLSFKKIKV
nr:RNA-directed DNA polymerase, eukaryota [Tanacetum cinerariifolium]